MLITKDSSLFYIGARIRLQGSVDSDMVGNVDGRKSTTGYVFTLSANQLDHRGKICCCNRNM